MPRRTVILCGILILLLVGSAGWACRHMAEQRRLASRARRNLGTCLADVAAIERMETRPVIADSHHSLAGEIVGEVEEAAKSANIPADKLVRITPRRSARVGDTAYKERPTEVSLRGVTLEHLVAMLNGLTRPEGDLQVKSIRLFAPGHDEDTSLWNAEFVVAYLVYEPPKTNR